MQILIFPLLALTCFFPVVLPEATTDVVGAPPMKVWFSLPDEGEPLDAVVVVGQNFRVGAVVMFGSIPSIIINK